MLLLDFVALGFTFTRPVFFLFKIEHDDGAVKHILSHLNTIGTI